MECDSRLRPKAVSALLILCSLGGCAGLLPKSENVTQTTWYSFNEAKQAIVSIVPNETMRDDLHTIGIDPYTNPSVTILTYPDILQRFAAGSAAIEHNLDPGVRDCLSAGKVCNGFAIDQSTISRKRSRMISCPCE